MILRLYIPHAFLLQERFVGLLMITKTKSPQSVDDITAIEKAVGYTFLRRLFHTTTDSTIGLLYPRLALSILSLYASSDKIVHSEPFRTIIQDAVEGLNMLLKTSLETERSQLQENKEQVLDIANNDQQLRQQCEISIVEGLQILIASLDAGLNLDIPNGKQNSNITLFIVGDAIPIAIIIPWLRWITSYTIFKLIPSALDLTKVLTNLLNAN